MKIITFLIADNIQQNPSNQKISVEGIFDTIFTESFPVIHKQLFALTIFKGVNKKYNYKITIEHKSKILTTSEDIIDKKSGQEHSIVSLFNDTPLEEPGEYTIKVKLDNQTIQKIINVKKAV